MGHTNTSLPDSAREDGLAAAGEDAVRLTRELIRRDSTNHGGGVGDERAAAEFAAEALGAAGLSPVVLESADRRANVVVRIPGTDPDADALTYHWNWVLGNSTTTQSKIQVEFPPEVVDSRAVNAKGISSRLNSVMACVAGATVSSANVPERWTGWLSQTDPNTSSPGRRSMTSRPTASTTPATSVPRTGCLTSSSSSEPMGEAAPRPNGSDPAGPCRSRQAAGTGACAGAGGTPVAVMGDGLKPLTTM